MLVGIEGDPSDTYRTPYGAYPGIGVVATVIDNIRSGDFIYPLPAWIHLAISLFLGLMAGGIVVTCRHAIEPDTIHKDADGLNIPNASNQTHVEAGFFLALILLGLYFFIAFLALGVLGLWFKVAPALIVLSLMMLGYAVVGYLEDRFRRIRSDLSEQLGKLGLAGKIAVVFGGLMIISLAVTTWLPKGAEKMLLKLIENLPTISAIVTAIALLIEKRKKKNQENHEDT
jgi:hypothetical protein